MTRPARKWRHSSLSSGWHDLRCSRLQDTLTRANLAPRNSTTLSQHRARRPVAAKFIAALAERDAAIHRFLIEPRAAARVQHPNIIARGLITAARRDGNRIARRQYSWFGLEGRPRPRALHLHCAWMRVLPARSIAPARVVRASRRARGAHAKFGRAPSPPKGWGEVQSIACHFGLI